MRSFIFLILFLGSTTAFSQSVFGKWITVDEDTNERKSVVEVYEEGGKVYGKIIKLFRKPDEDPDPVCDDCDEDDPRYMKKIIGMVIMEGMEKNGDEYRGGTILKPSTGAVYDCKIWRDGEKLKVRGYIAFLYKTQTWLPYSGE